MNSRPCKSLFRLPKISNAYPYAQSSSMFVHSPDTLLRYRHMIPMQLQTSGTKKNPMRRFMTCPFRGKEACDVFIWLEPPLEGRPRDVAIECLDKISRLKLDLARGAARERKLKSLIMLLLLILLMMMVVLFLRKSSGTTDGESHGLCKL